MGDAPVLKERTRVKAMHNDKGKRGARDTADVPNSGGVGILRQKDLEPFNVEGILGGPLLSQQLLVRNAVPFYPIKSYWD